MGERLRLLRALSAGAVLAACSSRAPNAPPGGVAAGANAAGSAAGDSPSQSGGGGGSGSGFSSTPRAGSGGMSAAGSAGLALGGSSGAISVGSAGSEMTGAAGMSQAGAGPSGPRFIGRFDMSNATAPVFAWSGTAIALHFQGAAIGVTLTDGGNNVFEVVVDGQHTVVTVQAGKKTYTLAAGLSTGAHDLLLYRRSEAFFGETTFNGFTLPQSAFLPGDPGPTRHLEVIGDSISAGYGNEGVFPCTFGAPTENHYLTYEALAARTLQADLYTEAWSGIGMLRNNDGGSTNTMPELYPRTLPGNANSAWNFASYLPDAVLINLGTNDFAKGDPGGAFQTTYTDFVKMLRGYYPSARLFLAVGPMLGGDSYKQALAYITAVVAARASAGDKNLAVLEFGTQDTANDGIGCDYHPSLKTHQKMADKMVSALKADLGW